MNTEKTEGRLTLHLCMSSWVCVARKSDCGSEPKHGGREDSHAPGRPQRWAVAAAGYQSRYGQPDPAVPLGTELAGSPSRSSRRADHGFGQHRASNGSAGSACERTRRTQAGEVTGDARYQNRGLWRAAIRGVGPFLGTADLVMDRLVPMRYTRRRRRPTRRVGGREVTADADRRPLSRECLALGHLDHLA